MGVPFYVTFCFSLDAFNIFSLNLIFISLINMCLGVFFLGFILYGTLLRFLDLGDYFLSHVREVFAYNLFKYFLRPFLFLFFFWDAYNSNVGVFSVVPEVSEIVFNSFHSFSLFCSLAVISTILPSSTFIHSSASVIPLLIPSSVFFISVIVLFISLCFLDFGDYFLSHVREVFNYNLYKYFLRPFLFLFFFWDPYNSNVGAFSAVPEVSEIVFNSFHSFSLFCSLAVISTILSSSSLIRYSASVIVIDSF